MTVPFPRPDQRVGRVACPDLVREQVIEIPGLKGAMGEGTLFVVSTPIGNLEDITLRAVRVLRECDGVACEDTRVTGRLLRHLEIHKPLYAYHDANENRVWEQLIERLARGESLCLLSDAGTPLLSDPGFPLVRECRRRGIAVVAVPGASSLTAALSVAGLPTDRFEFRGFLPPKASARKRFFDGILECRHTVVVFESCHRIAKFMTEAAEHLPPTRQIAVCRELTKRFETVSVGDLEAVKAKVLSDPQKGEYVVVLAGSNYAG